MSDHVIIYAEYGYQASITLRRHRLSQGLNLRATTPVRIPRLDEAEAPVALVLHEEKPAGYNTPAITKTIPMRWDGERLLRPLEGPDGKQVSLEDFAARMTGRGMWDPVKREEVAWQDNPLLKVWKGQDGKVQAGTLFRLGRREDQHDVRDWHNDDSEAKAVETRKRAEILAVVGDMVYRACPEPTWKVPLNYGEVSLERSTPSSESNVIRFPLDRVEDADALHAMVHGDGEKRYVRKDRAEVRMPDCLRRTGLAMNARTLFDQVVPELGAMLPHFARGDAARAWADLRDAEHAWRGGAQDALHEAYGALRRMTEVDWTAAPGTKDYHVPKRQYAERFLAAYDTFEAPRLDDLAFADIAPACDGPLTVRGLSPWTRHRRQGRTDP